MKPAVATLVSAGVIRQHESFYDSMAAVSRTTCRKGLYYRPPPWLTRVLLHITHSVGRSPVAVVLEVWRHFWKAVIVGFSVLQHSILFSNLSISSVWSLEKCIPPLLPWTWMSIVEYGWVMVVGNYWTESAISLLVSSPSFKRRLGHFDFFKKVF